MSRLQWDSIGERLYQTGVDHTVLYPYENDSYSKAEVWNGVTEITESPSGAENNDVYADNIKYLSLRGAEIYGLTINCFTYPEMWEECNGRRQIAPGVYIGQQPRKTFGLSYRTIVGNDTMQNSYGYKIHLVYGCTTSPSELGHETINDSPEPGDFSFEISTIPVPVGETFTANIEIDSTKVDKEKLKELEDILYGTAETEARLPLPEEIQELFAA